MKAGALETYTAGTSFNFSIVKSGAGLKDLVENLYQVAYKVTVK